MPPTRVVFKDVAGRTPAKVPHQLRESRMADEVHVDALAAALAISQGIQDLNAIVANVRTRREIASLSCLCQAQARRCLQVVSRAEAIKASRP